MNVGIISWQNETKLQSYPFQRSFGMEGFILDANFIQFNGFIPVLMSILVSETTLAFTFKIDIGIKTFTYSTNGLGTFIKMYDGTRYIGKLIFGNGLSDVLEQNVDQTIMVNTPVLPHLVKAIPKTAGVYTIAGEFGNVTWTSDNNIYFLTNGETVTFNAVGLPKANSELFLRTLNNVGPTNNNVYIQESDKIKVGSNALNTIEISMIGTSSEDILQNLNPVITTNPAPAS